MFSRQLLIAIGSIMLLPAEAVAGEGFSNIVGNTLEIKTGSGKAISISPRADGTYAGISPNGEDIAGTWKADRDGMCFTRSVPAPAEPVCLYGLADKSVGDSWKNTDAEGRSADISLV